jgi:endonuclease VIII
VKGFKQIEIDPSFDFSHACRGNLLFAAKAGICSLRMPENCAGFQNMPEGHTLHRAALDQRPMLVGHPLDVSSPQGRFMEGAERIDGRICTAIEAYGKHLLYCFDDEALHIHLGLFGVFKLQKCPAAEPKGAVRVRMKSKSHCVDINGPNCCEVIDMPARATLIARIGPDVLRSDADPERAWARISRSKTPIGLLLMDQSVISGIGNIYRSEILWRQKVSPMTPGNAISRETFERLWSDAVHLLKIGVKANSIITVDGVKKARSRYGERVNIFNKSHCPECASEIRCLEMASRRAFICDTCQPELR